MAEVNDYTICLRFFGDELDPDVVSSLLGAQPSSSCRKGDVFHGKVSDRIEKTGKWLLRVSSNPGESFEPRIEGLLSGLTQDLTAWHGITEKYNADLFCGVWLASTNEGMELSAGLMARLAERGLHLGLDIYAPDDHDDG